VTDLTNAGASALLTEGMSLIDRIRSRRHRDAEGEIVDDLDLVAMVNEARSDRERSRVVREAAARRRSRRPRR
jgi:hypothetical protein